MLPSSRLISASDDRSLFSAAPAWIRDASAPSMALDVPANVATIWLRTTITLVFGRSIAEVRAILKRYVACSLSRPPVPHMRGQW